MTWQEKKWRKRGVAALETGKEVFCLVLTYRALQCLYLETASRFDGFPLFLDLLLSYLSITIIAFEVIVFMCDI